MDLNEVKAFINASDSVRDLISIVDATAQRLDELEDHVIEECCDDALDELDTISLEELQVIETEGEEYEA